MGFLQTRYLLGGVELPELGLWLDPHRPQQGRERVFISHAHADHLAKHREVILSAPTARLMQTRLGGERVQHILHFGVPREFENFSITLLPAGHIFGSAMAWVESRGRTLLYTGDFKLRPGLSSETCQPRPADVLIMETTYGRSEYSFPPTQDVLQAVVRFCREALDNDETPVLLGYSLGRSQEVLSGLAGAGLPIMLHERVHRLTKVYEGFGQSFPVYEAFDARRAQGKVLVAPSAGASAWLRHVGPVRTAVLTGWAVDPGYRFRSRVDAAFPLSDHADFADLLRLVDLVNPKRVLTLHGFAADFAEVLRERGYDARALSEPEQLGLGLNLAPAAPKNRIEQGPVQHSSIKPDPWLTQHQTDQESAGGTDLFRHFAEVCAAVGGQSSKLEKARLVATYLKRVPKEHLIRVTLWLTGTPFAPSEGKALQVGWALLRDAICQVSGITPAEFRSVYAKRSELGETIHQLVCGPSAEPLRLSQVDELLHQMQQAPGLEFLVRLLSACLPLEAKFVVKILSGDLRIGLKEEWVEEAIASAFKLDRKAVREANLLLGNLGLVAELGGQGALAQATLKPFQPLRFMLASPQQTAEDTWQRMYASHEPVWLEERFNGIRCQLHKLGTRVRLYASDLSPISFPEIAQAALALPGDMIVDGVILGLREKEPRSQMSLFGHEPDLFLRTESPLVCFDALWAGGVSLLESPLRDRRVALERMIPSDGVVRHGRLSLAHSVEELTLALADARRQGNKGLVAKDPHSPYSPGRRSPAWIQL